jgi:hypothetical protein
MICSNNVLNAIDTILAWNLSDECFEDALRMQLSPAL